MSTSQRPSGHGSELELVRLSDAPLRLVEALYTELLQTTFPPDELEPLEALLGALGETTDGVLAHRDGRVAGGLVYDHYVDGTVQLLAYLVVDPSARGHGLGSLLLRRGLGQSTSRLVLGEIEDPRHWPTTAVSDPAARLRFWARSGCRLLALPYVQPSLDATARRVRHLLLIVVPPQGNPLPEAVPGDLVGRFLREYFTASEGSFDPDDDELAPLLRSCDVESLRLWPLDHLEVVD
ncbi:GNAT family N-acetyltransferase [Xylanimonas protaetiae]|uniref:GNAT family N-acetyltransferase n=1 Tax=Xylanimonas protaetiae TaxID=2509457 RepID=A0A4P6F5S7_9MICO|nr:GNAT family N-acetyltransferase [Xylanimonas protaetiae]QAY70746.1 GNAT family N-acetyltransferase [Xylanimonas protaetiae]